MVVVVDGEAATLQTAARVVAGFLISRLEPQPQDKETTAALDRSAWVGALVAVAGHLPQVPQQPLRPVGLAGRGLRRP